jgi:hypothetical protein
MQSKKRSWKEAWINIFIGYSINFVANLVVFPMFGYNVTIHDNLIIGVIFTFISLARQYVVRRFMNKGDIQEFHARTNS